jgi:hypothetical protein
MLVALALALAAPAAPAAPASPSAPAEISAASLASGPYRAEALRLSQTMMPADRYIAMLEAAFVNGFRLALTKDDSFERESPGIGDELVQATLKAARPFFATTHRASLLTYARFYSRTLSTAEIADLDALYRSPLGQKLLDGKYGHVSSPQFASTIDSSKATTRTDIDNINRDATKSLVGGLTADDVSQLAALSKKPVFATMKALKPQIARLEAEQANDSDPAFDAAVSAAIEAVMKRRGIKR